jgi:hypothetical protein
MAGSTTAEPSIRATGKSESDVARLRLLKRKQKNATTKSACKLGTDDV